MSKAHDDVMKMIEKKMRYTTSYNKKKSTEMGLNAIISEFMDNVEIAMRHATNAMDVDDGINRSARQLEIRMKGLDEGVKVEVVWHNEDESSWKDLIVDGVRVMWSDKYIASHSGAQNEQYIDIGVLLIEGSIT